jgi:Putative cyclase
MWIRPSFPRLATLASLCAGTLALAHPADAADAPQDADAPPAHSAHQGQGPAARPGAKLQAVYSTLAARRFVDLTHSFGPDTPHWKGFGEMKVRTLYTIAKDGFHVDEFCHVGQWGTHVDPPAHFHEGKKTVDQIDPKDMLLPLVVLDVHEKAARNPDYLLTL